MTQNSNVPEKFSIINHHLMTRNSKKYEGTVNMASKPTINQMSAYLSYKDEYANHDVFDRLTRGRDTIVKTTRAERRLTDALTSCDLLIRSGRTNAKIHRIRAFPPHAREPGPEIAVCS